MMQLEARSLGYRLLNEIIRETEEDVVVSSCYGERFIGCGASSKTIVVNGTPGNALGAYLDGATIIVNGNAQDAVGDTMNDGRIIIHGNAGDALGYAMRGGKIFVKGDAGYRTGIHMKEYKDKKPVIVVGGTVGSFLGEYMAGGLIVVLGLNSNKFPCGFYAGTVMHGGEIYVGSFEKPCNIPKEVNVEEVDREGLEGIMDVLREFSGHFSVELEKILNRPFYRMTPDRTNPLKQLYTAN